MDDRTSSFIKREFKLVKMNKTACAPFLYEMSVQRPNSAKFKHKNNRHIKSKCE
jgi:hypothetical protein